MRERNRRVREPDDLEVLRLFRQSRMEHGEYSADLRARWPELAARLEAAHNTPAKSPIPPLPWAGQLWNGVRFPSSGPPAPYREPPAAS